MSLESIKINKNRMVDVIKTSLLAKEQNQGLFENIVIPEEKFIKLIKEHGQNIADDKFALHALFLTTQMIHGESTQLALGRIANLKLIEKYSWIFDPKKVSQAENEDVIDACTKFFRPGGYNITVFGQWQHNCQIIENNYSGDLRNFFEKNNNDATKIVDSLIVFPRAKTENKKEFRRFGPKLSRLFIQWVNQYNFYKLENANSICIPVDFQVCRIMLQTNAVEIDKAVSIHSLSTKTLLPSISNIIDENSLKAREVSESLWFIGSNGCGKNRCNLCPLDIPYCDKFIHRTSSYDLTGLFSPEDFCPKPSSSRNK